MTLGLKSHDSPFFRIMNLSQPILNEFCCFNMVHFEGKFRFHQVMIRVIRNSGHHLMTFDSDSLLKNLCVELRVKSHDS